MRIRTRKLKAPSPITVLLICLIWPLAAVVGATLSDTERADTPSFNQQPINDGAPPPNLTSDISRDAKGMASSDFKTDKAKKKNANYQRS